MADLNSRADQGQGSLARKAELVTTAGSSLCVLHVVRCTAFTVREQIRNLYRKSDGTYSAYMCKQCHFGPVDHGWCTALNTHHGEAKGETGHVNNACPKCNWFAKSISAWPKWDGKFQTAGASSSSSAPAINVFALSVPELKAELKKYGAGVQGSKPVLQQRLQNMLHPGGAS
eukprot:2818578-Pleurochrysis_carterae.AAC.2